MRIIDFIVFLKETTITELETQQQDPQTTQTNTKQEALSRNVRVKKKRRLRRFIGWGIATFIVGTIVATNGFYNLRYILAEDLYTSQHRYLAKYLLPGSSLSQIAYQFMHPALVNLFPSGTSQDVSGVPTASQISKSIQVQTLNENGFTAYEITIAHPSWLHLVKTTGGPAGRGLTLRESMNLYHAIAGINAGGFNDPGGDGNGGTPIGLIIINGKLVSPASYLAGTNQVMGMTAGGKWFMGAYSTSYMLSQHVKYAIQFGPELIANGKVLVTGTDGWGYAPRTVIGQKANGSIVFYVNDGRWGNGFWDVGASLGQVASIMASQGVVNAFNLDGGGSATMMVHLPGKPAQLVNTPDTNNPPYGMRFLPDAFLIIPPRA